MKLSPTYRMPFKRRLEGKTDYHKRLEILKSKMPQLVIRKSLNYVRAQVTEFDKKGDKTLSSANSKELKKLGWTFSCDNLPAAYLTGLLIGKKSLKNNVNEVILNSGLYTSVKGSRIYAAVKGALDAGLKVPVNEEILPSDDRIKGEHITKFKNLPVEFEKVKQKILSG